MKRLLMFYCSTVIVIGIVFHLMYRTFADCVYMSVHSLPVCLCACLNLTIKITIHCFNCLNCLAK